MPRRNVNATIPRTRNRDRTPIKAMRTALGLTYVVPLSKPTDDGLVLVLLAGTPTYVSALDLINV